MQVGRDHPHGVRVDKDLRLQGLLEKAQQVQRIGQEFGLVLVTQATVYNCVAFGCAIPVPRHDVHEAAADIRLLFDVIRLELGQEDPCQVADMGRMPEISLHELFDPEQAFLILEAQNCGDFRLRFKSQFFGCPAG